VELVLPKFMVAMRDSLIVVAFHEPRGSRGEEALDDLAGEKARTAAARLMLTFPLSHLHTFNRANV
jgi:hypothetical protein